MYKCGLKLWSTNTEMIGEAQRLFDRSVFDYIELFVVPGSSSAYLDAWQAVDIPILLHAPHSYSGLNMSLKENEHKNRDLIGETEVFRKALSSNLVIFHPGVGGSPSETIRQILSFRQQYEILFRAAIMENKPCVGLKGENCVGSMPEEIENIMSSTGLGFCFDIGHSIHAAAAMMCDPYEMIDRFIALEPQVYHLSDGDMSSHVDMHLNYGKGNFDLKWIIGRIPEDAHVTIETKRKQENDFSDFIMDVECFRKMEKHANLET